MWRDVLGWFVRGLDFFTYGYGEPNQVRECGVHVRYWIRPDKVQRRDVCYLTVPLCRIPVSGSKSIPVRYVLLSCLLTRRSCAQALGIGALPLREVRTLVVQKVAGIDIARFLVMIGLDHIPHRPRLMSRQIQNAAIKGLRRCGLEALTILSVSFAGFTNPVGDDGGGILRAGTGQGAF